MFSSFYPKFESEFFPNVVNLSFFYELETPIFLIVSLSRMLKIMFFPIMRPKKVLLMHENRPEDFYEMIEKERKLA